MSAALFFGGYCRWRLKHSPVFYYPRPSAGHRTAGGDFAVLLSLASKARDSGSKGSGTSKRGCARAWRSCFSFGIYYSLYMCFLSSHKPGENPAGEGGIRGWDSGRRGREALRHLFILVELSVIGEKTMSNLRNITCRSRHDVLQLRHVD